MKFLFKKNSFEGLIYSFNSDIEAIFNLRSVLTEVHFILLSSRNTLPLVGEKEYNLNQKRGNIITSG